MKDYKDEIQEVLAEDKQLMAEIEFDLKRFEQQEKMEATRQSIAYRPERIPAPPELASLRNDNATLTPVNEQSNTGVQVGAMPVTSQEVLKEVPEGSSSALDKDISVKDHETNPGINTAGFKERTSEGPECEAPELGEEIPAKNSKDPGSPEQRKSKEIEVGKHLTENQEQAEAPETRPVRRSSRGQKSQGDTTQQSNLLVDEVENAVEISREIDEPPTGTEANREDGNKSQPHAKNPTRSHSVAQKRIEEKSFAKPNRRPTHGLLQPKVFISTPVRNIPVDEVSFNIRDVDISHIPHIEPKAKRRRV